MHYLEPIKESYIYYLAFNYWNFDIIPPEEYIIEVAYYIKNHPEYFKGATPQ